MIPAEPLAERAKLLTEGDWEDVEHVARAMFMQNDMTYEAAEALALVQIIRDRAAGARRVLH